MEDSATKAVEAQNQGEENCKQGLLDENSEDPVEMAEHMSEPTTGTSPSYNTCENDLHTALKKKTNLRIKLLKTNHHLSFLEDCRTNDKTPKGLSIPNGIRLADTRNSSDTMNKINDIYRKAERDVCEVLIGHL